MTSSIPPVVESGIVVNVFGSSCNLKQALPGGQVQTPLGPGDEAWRKEQERKGGVQWFLQKTWLSFKS